MRDDAAIPRTARLLPSVRNDTRFKVNLFKPFTIERKEQKTFLNLFVCSSAFSAPSAVIPFPLSPEIGFSNMLIIDQFRSLSLQGDGTRLQNIAFFGQA